MTILLFIVLFLGSGWGVAVTILGVTTCTVILELGFVMS